MGTGFVLFADERLVAIDKPAGVSLATRRREPGAAVERLLAAIPESERTACDLEARRLWLVHRLDVGTTGLVLLARDPETHRELVRSFAERRVEKRYLALVWGRPRPRQGSFEWPLGPDLRDRRRMRVDPAGRQAASAYLVLAHRQPASLVELVPATGRTHQLRVHLAHAGHPIVGDDLYGGPRHRGVRDAALRQALQPWHPLLHAWRLRLSAPGGGELELAAPLPAELITALQALGLPAPAGLELPDWRA
ncbi:MAG: RluA family pseudouridine synthase [Acidobacteriota bacterium]